MNRIPSISVVIPLYNKAEFVAEAIESIRRQSLSPLEILVIDDGSTDKSVDAVERMMTGGDIRLIRQKNAGVAAARNRGVDEACGDFIAFLDADDRYHPDFLESISNLIKEYPGAGMSCTGYLRVWGDGRRRESLMPTVKSGAKVVVESFYSSWCDSSFTCTNAIVLRASIFDDADLRFPLGERLGEDQDLWFRIAERHKVIYLNAARVDYRMAVSGSATQSSSVVDELPCYMRLSERLSAGRVPPHMVWGGRRLLASHLLNVVRARLAHGDRKNAYRLLFDRRTVAHPTYFLRTVVVFTLGAWWVERGKVS